MKCWLGKSALDTEKAVCVYVCEENEDKRVWSTSLCMSAPVSSRVSACQTCMVYVDPSMCVPLQVCGVPYVS